MTYSVSYSLMRKLNPFWTLFKQNKNTAAHTRKDDILPVYNIIVKPVVMFMASWSLV